jgi:coenzyme F420-0:L-glutamate ligase/coenzyme F420-1:gamma-L-glutamate ligase
VADELAGAAELAQGKLGGRPFAVVRGRADLVLPADDDGPGAVALVRPDGMDMFGYVAREAVLHALRGDRADARPFGSPASADDVVAALAEFLDAVATVGDGVVSVDGLDPRQAWAVGVAAYAMGWQVTGGNDSRVDLRPSPLFT